MENIFTSETSKRIQEILGQTERSLLLQLTLDNSPLSAELEDFITALTKLSDKLSFQVIERNGSYDIAPCVTVCTKDGHKTGLSFHGVPLGHELMSFITGLYNTAGPGQELDGATRAMIDQIKSPVDIKVLITLSCPMCPDLVIAAQHISAINSNVTASIYDVNHFRKLGEKYNVMSVPCLIINDAFASVGKMNIRQLLDLINKNIPC